MPRMYHSGKPHASPVFTHIRFGSVVKVPPAYRDAAPYKDDAGGYYPAKEGAIVFGIPEFGFWTVPPVTDDGAIGSIDVPFLSAEQLKAVAGPELLTEDEAETAGLITRQRKAPAKFTDVNAHEGGGRRQIADDEGKKERERIDARSEKKDPTDSRPGKPSAKAGENV